MTMPEWNGFKRIDFKFSGKEAILIFPEEGSGTGRWLLKTEYFDAFPDMEIEFLKRGFHLAYVKNVTRWGSEEDQDTKFELAKFLSREYGLSSKCVPIGMSCGGLHAVNLAASHPECVSVLYLDAPVMNLLSCPASLGKAKYDEELWKEFYEHKGITLSELISYRQHPIDKMDILLKNNIPIAMVYGDSDTVVPYSENGAILERYYRDNGGTILAIGKEGCGHHPHCLKDSTPVIEFIAEHCR